MTDTDYSEEVSDIVDALEAKFQEKLVSGSNIKTINNKSLLGSGNINVEGGGGSFEPELVYTCSNFNSTYINTSATNRLELYKLGTIYFIRYFITTKTLTSASTDYLINNDSISSEYRPSSNITFHIPTSSNHNAKLTINTSGQIRISADADSVAISFAGSQTYWWAEAVSPVVALSLSSSSVSYGSSVTLSATVTSGGVAVVGETVTFYDGSTSLGTGTTNSSGVATLTKSDWSVSTHSLTAVYGSVTSSAETLTVSKATPTISLATSSSTITYGTSITLSGTLSSLGSGASVKIYDGNTLLDTVTTGTGGAFTCSTSSLTVGSHSLTAVFEGNTNYNNVTSSAVSVNVSKITSTISLSAVSSTITVGDSPQLTGTLSVGSGQTVYITDGDTVLGSVTTGTNGAFSYTGSATSTAGTLTFQAVYDGDSTHTDAESSVVSITVQAAPSYDSIDLTSDKSIISYADGESATLTAQLQENGTDAPISGVSLSFVIKKGSTVIDTKTATTGADGSCSVSYVGQGTGDLNIQCSDGSILSITYVVEDCTRFDGTTSNRLSEYSITRYGSSFDTDHYLLTNSTTWSLNFLKVPLTNLSNFIFEADIKLPSRGSNPNFGLLVTKASEISSNGISNNRTELMDYTSSYGMYMEDKQNTGHLTDNQWYRFRYTVKSDGTVQGEIIDLTDNTTVFNQTVTDSHIINYLKECYIHSRGGTSTIHVKNIKVKSL